MATKPQFPMETYKEPDYASNISNILNEIIARYQPGGGFGKAATKVYEQQKGKSLASSRQSLVSAGLGGTSVGAGLETAYEQEVGQPFRLGVEEARTGALTQAMMAKAGFMEREGARKGDFETEERARRDRAMENYNRLAFGGGRRGGGAISSVFGDRGDSGGEWTPGGGGSSYEGLGQRNYTDGGQEGGSTYRIAEGYGPMFGTTEADVSKFGYTGSSEMPIGGPLSEAYQQKRQDKIMSSIQPLNVMKSGGGKIASVTGGKKGPVNRLGMTIEETAAKAGIKLKPGQNPRSLVGLVGMWRGA